MPINPLMTRLVQKRMLRSFKHFSDKGRGVSPCKFYPTEVSGTPTVVRNIYHDIETDQITNEDGYSVIPINTYCYIDLMPPAKSIIRAGFAYKEGDTLPVLCYMPIQIGITPENNSLIVLLSDEGVIQGRWSISQCKIYAVNSPALLYVATVVPYRDKKSARIT